MTNIVAYLLVSGLTHCNEALINLYSALLVCVCLVSVTKMHGSEDVVRNITSNAKITVGHEQGGLPMCFLIAHQVCIDQTHKGLSTLL